MSARTLVLAMVLVLTLGGCGVGLLQTAKTTPKGHVTYTFAGGYAHNEMVDERGVSPSSFPQTFGVRYGVTHQLDLGARLFLLAGGIADVKLNFIRHDSPLAVSLQGGFGGAANVDPAGMDGWLLHLPVSALASYRVHRRLTPYVGLGYGFCWIFDRKPPSNAPPTGSSRASRAGHGDGLLLVNAGLEVAVNDRFAIMLEYDLWKPVVDDPGDFYAFVDNHMVFVGFRY